MNVPVICLLGSTLSAAGAASAADLPDRGQITALSKTFLRDSAELPMDVLVKTVVTDAKGKKKRDAQSNVQFVFSGYNAATEKYSFRSTAGFMSLRILHDSIAGNFAAINAFSRLTPHGSNPAEMTIEPGEPGGAFIIRSKAAADCHGFSMPAKFLYGEHYCYTTVFRVTRDAAGKLAIQDFAVDIEQFPAPGKVRYLGEVQVRKIHSAGEVQEARMGDDPRPFLIPKRVTTIIETDKGAVVVTNDYTLHKETKK
jgi:hypothetical protein